MTGDVAVDSADGALLFGNAEQVNRKHFPVGEVRVGVVTLSLGSGANFAAVTSANEQVHPNEHMLWVHVAKGGLRKMASSTTFKLPAATWFFNR